MILKIGRVWIKTYVYILNVEIECLSSSSSLMIIITVYNQIYFLLDTYQTEVCVEHYKYLNGKKEFPLYT